MAPLDESDGLILINLTAELVAALDVVPVEDLEDM